MAFASIAAATLVGTLSFAFYVVAMLLGRVRPLREAINFSPGRTTASSPGWAKKFCATPETRPRYESWSPSPLLPYQFS